MKTKITRTYKDDLPIYFLLHGSNPPIDIFSRVNQGILM